MPVANEKASLPKVSIEQIEVFADNLDVAKAARIYREYGALVVRGLMKPYVNEIYRDIEAAVAETIALFDQAIKIPEGWRTPNGTLLLPAPKNFKRDKQIMVLGVGYNSSAAFFRSAFEPKAVALAAEILGPNVELFLDGQCLYKEPVGGHPKHLHQDAAYFEHKFEGPVGVLNYVVDTNVQNGALHVVPGSHRLGVLDHVDTFSHLGLDERHWPWESALPICGAPGDSIFFHVKTIHGSKENRSNGPRPVFIHRYRRSDDFVVVGATSTSNRSDAEKKSAMAKKENQKGLMVSGYRAFEARS